MGQPTKNNNGTKYKTHSDEQIPKKSSTVAEDEKTDRGRALNLTRWGNWITGISAFLSLVGLVFIWRTLAVTKQSADAAVSQAETARDEYQLGQRPWVRIETRSGPLVINGKALWLDKPISRIINVGHSVAVQTFTRLYLMPDGEGTGKECLPPTDPQEIRKFYSDPATGVLLFPETAVEDGRHPAFANLQGPKMLHLVACVIYRSPIDPPEKNIFHYTEVSYRVFHAAKDPELVGSPTFEPSKAQQIVPVRLSVDYMRGN